MLKIGDVVKRKKDTVKVIDESLTFLKVEDQDGRDFWVTRRELEEGVLVTAMEAEAKTPAPVQPPSVDIAAVNIDAALVPYVTKLRIVYPEKSQAYLNEQAAKHGVILDPRTRPVRAGIRGGTTIQRSPAATVEFSADAPVGSLPVIVKNLPTGNFRVNSIAFAFALLKAGAKQTAFA